MNCIHRIREYLSVRVQKWYKRPRNSLFQVPLCRHPAQDLLLYHSINYLFLPIQCPSLCCRKLKVKLKGGSMSKSLYEQGAARGTHPSAGSLDTPTAKGFQTQKLNTVLGGVHVIPWMVWECSSSSFSFNMKNHLFQPFLEKAQAGQAGSASCPAASCKCPTLENPPLPWRHYSNGWLFSLWVFLVFIRKSVPKSNLYPLNLVLSMLTPCKNGVSIFFVGTL